MSLELLAGFLSLKLGSRSLGYIEAGEQEGMGRTLSRRTVQMGCSKREGGGNHAKRTGGLCHTIENVEFGS